MVKEQKQNSDDDQELEWMGFGDSSKTRNNFLSLLDSEKLKNPKLLIFQYQGRINIYIF